MILVGFVDKRVTGAAGTPYAEAVGVALFPWLTREAAGKLFTEDSFNGGEVMHRSDGMPG